MRPPRAALWQYLLGVDLVGNVAADRLPDRRAAPAPRSRTAVARASTTSTTICGSLRSTLARCSRRGGTRCSTVISCSRCTDLDGRAVRFAVEGNDRDAQCAETDAAPDVSCSIAVLGALMLGGNRLTEYAQAGLVQEHGRGKLAYADAMFLTSPPPASDDGLLAATGCRAGRCAGDRRARAGSAPSRGRTSSDSSGCARRAPNCPASSRSMRCGASTNATPAAASAVVVDLDVVDREVRAHADDASAFERGDRVLTQRRRTRGPAGPKRAMSGSCSTSR